MTFASNKEERRVRAYSTWWWRAFSRRCKKNGKKSRWRLERKEIGINMKGTGSRAWSLHTTVTSLPRRGNRCSTRLKLFGLKRLRFKSSRALDLHVCMIKKAFCFRRTVRATERSTGYPTQMCPSVSLYTTRRWRQEWSPLQETPTAKPSCIRWRETCFCFVHWRPEQCWQRGIKISRPWEVHVEGLVHSQDRRHIRRSDGRNPHHLHEGGRAGTRCDHRERSARRPWEVHVDEPV